MNPFIKSLAETSLKKRKRIIGLMSGTSLDGLDIALCDIEGNGFDTVVKVVEFITMPYGENQKELLKRVSFADSVLLKDVCYLHTWLAGYHSKLIMKALKRWNMNSDQVDCIASHGQTIYHYPARDQRFKNPENINSTFQIGDGDHLAYKTGVLTVSDFRQKHTAAGGEGAPMAALVDGLLFGHPTEGRILLNIGGIANFTYLPPESEKERSLFTTDTGPGNTLIDNLSRRYFNREYDEDGKIAISGNINFDLLKVLLKDDFFQIRESKSTGPEIFNHSWIERVAVKSGIDLSLIPPEDLISTVTELSAVTIADFISFFVRQKKVKEVYVSGGGLHNPVLLERISDLLDNVEVKSISALGIDPDAKEAVIFAVLANEMLSGEGFSFQAVTGRKERVNFGKISFPV